MWPISQVKRKSVIEAPRGREGALLGTGDCENLDMAVEGRALRGQAPVSPLALTQTLFSQAVTGEPASPAGRHQTKPPLALPRTTTPQPGFATAYANERNRIKPNSIRQ